MTSVHAGNSSIWSTPWCPIWDSAHDHLRLPGTVTPLPAKASDLWVPNTHDWNIPLLSNIFDDAAIQTITATQSIPSDQQDILRWKPSRTGKCSTKRFTSCYPQPTQCSYHNKDQEASAPTQLISCAELGGPKNSLPSSKHSHGGSLEMQWQQQREQEDTHKYQDIAAPVVS